MSQRTTGVDGWAWRGDNTLTGREGSQGWGEHMANFGS